MALLKLFGVPFYSSRSRWLDCSIIFPCMVVQQITALLKLFGVYLSIHPEVDDRIAAGVEECEEENDGVDESMVVP